MNALGYSVAGATITVNGNTAASEAASCAIALAVGSDTIITFIMPKTVQTTVCPRHDWRTLGITEILKCQGAELFSCIAVKASAVNY